MSIETREKGFLERCIRRWAISARWPSRKMRWRPHRDRRIIPQPGETLNEGKVRSGAFCSFGTARFSKPSRYKITSALTHQQIRFSYICCAPFRSHERAIEMGRTTVKGITIDQNVRRRRVWPVEDTENTSCPENTPRDGRARLLAFA